MKPMRLLCNDCSLEFDSFACYEEHAGGKEHQQQVAEVFQTVPHNGQVHLPHFTLGCVSDPRTYPVIGLQLVSLCISTEGSTDSFYLCHACHEKCRSDLIITHLRSVEHYFYVFAYLNPGKLHFGWFHPPANVPGLKVKAEEEEKQQGTGVLRVIDMPKKVFEKTMKTSYFQAIKELTYSDKLKEIYKVHLSKSRTVQEYLRNPARTQPLLGLNFLVEYSCMESSKLCGYLCLLCKKRVRETQIIAHIISFDHLYWYLDHVHPSSMYTKSCYTFGENYMVLILDLAKQAQEISTSGEVQKIELDAEDFTVVDTGSYANALDLLKVIHKEQSKSDLLPQVAPAQRLVFSQKMTQSQPAVLEPILDSQQRTKPDRTGLTSVVVQRQRLSCLVCAPGAMFFNMKAFKIHMRGGKHKRKVEHLFQTALNRFSVFIPRMVLYEYIRTQMRGPIIGVHLVTACIDTQTAKQPFYLCHICQDKCTGKVILEHLTSSTHYFHALACMDPERLHFGWMSSQNMQSILEPQVRAVENEQGTGFLQVLDMPETWFNHIVGAPYTQAVKQLCQDEELKERLRVRNWTKLGQYHSNPNRKYPLLGLKFLLEYRCTDGNKLCGYLCLLCKKTVREPLVISHLIGFEHVFSYLDLAHPSSLDGKSLCKSYDACYGALMLDLATQAENIDSSGKVQDIKLDRAVYEEVDSSQFLDALQKLQAVSGEKITSYIPLLVTLGQGLVPKTHKPALSLEQKCPAQSLEQKCPSQSLEQKCPAQSLEQKRPAQSLEQKCPAQSLEQKCPAQSLEQKCPAQSLEQKCPAQSLEQKCPAQSLEQKRPAQSLKQQRPAQSLKQQRPAQCLEQKRPAQCLEQKRPAQCLEQKRRAQSLEQKCLPNLTSPSKASQKLWDYLKNKERREPVIGLDAVIECTSDNVPPYYLCETCSQKMSQDFIIDHLTTPCHRYQYLKSQQLLSCSVENIGLNTGAINERAVTVEKARGFGEAQVFDLDGTQYKEIVSSSFDVALNRLRTIQKEQSDCQHLQTSQPKQDIQTVNMQEPTDEPSPNVKCTGKSLFFGLPDETTVSKLLDNYLKSKLSTLPVIGLSSLIEFYGENKPDSMVCKTCSKAVSINSIIGHLIGPTHRYKYIKSEHPDLLRGWSDNPSMTENITKLHTIAQRVEKEEGCGQFTVIKWQDHTVELIGPTSNSKVQSVQISAALQPPENYSDPERMSQLLTFLKKKKKKQTVALIGLREMIECTAVNRSAFYICTVCKTMIHNKLIMLHVAGLWHRINYIKMQYPSWLKPGTKKLGSKRQAYVQKLAGIIQDKEGIGDVQVVELDEVLHGRPVSKSTDNALEHLQMFQEEQMEQEVTSSFNPELVPKQPPCLLNQHDAANKEERVMIQPALQDPESTKANEVPVKLEKMESLEHSEEPIQDSQHPEPEQAIKACGMVPSLVAPQKHSLDPKWQKAKLAKRTCKLEKRSLQVQLPVAVKQEPGIPAVPQHPECTSTHTVTGIENDAFLVCGPSEKPLQTSELEEFKWDAACKNSAQSPSPSGQPVLLSKDAALEQAPLRETVYRQMTPRAPPQDPRWAVPDRVEIPVGESHFSKFMLSFMTHEPEPLLGLRVVVECRSFKQPTFYLCLTCAEKVSMKHICNHIISDRHRYYYIYSKYPDLILDWEDNPTGVAWWVQRHERVSDVQVMKLDLNLYNQVASVPFGAALELLQVSRREQSFLQPFLTPGHRPIILNNWTLPPQKIPETPKQNPDKTGLPKAPIEQAIRHQEISLHPQQCQTVLGPQQCLTVLGPGPGQTVQTALGPGQDPKLTETDGASPRYSVCMSEKRRQGPGLPQEASRDLEETRRRRVDCRMDTVEHGGAPEERERAAENPDQAEAAEAQAVLAPASPWEPWLNLKGTETDNEKVCRPPLDLQTYIQDPQRTQPLVGLSALVECHSEKQASFFLCMACCILLKTRFIEHVIGPKHRNSYLLKRRPDLFREGCTSQDSAKRASYLLEVAKEVEREECGGVGDIQKLSFDSATYTKVKSMPFDKALNLVQTIYKEQKHCDLQTHVSPAAIPVMVKQEKVEHEECSGESIQDPQITGSGQSHDTPQEPVQRQKSRGTEDCPGVENPTGTGSGMKTPLIGLQVVIKCVSVDGWPPPIYLCQACSTKLTGNQQTIIKHLISSQHQYFYIRCRHPNRLEKEKEAGSLTCGMTDLVQFVAKKLEKEEGSGSFQVINLAQNDYERFKLRNYEYCMRTLKSCNGVEARQSCLKPGKGNSDQNAAPRGPGHRSPQNSGPRSDASRDGPSTLPPVVSEGHRLAEMRTQERTSVKRRLNCLESPPALATHRPSGHTGHPSLERSLSQPLAPSHPECVLQRASEPWAKTPGAHATTACPTSMSAGKVPQSVSVWGKKCQASSSTQCNPTDDVTARRLSEPEAQSSKRVVQVENELEYAENDINSFDAPPVKIPRLDYGDLKEGRL